MVIFGGVLLFSSYIIIFGCCCFFFFFKQKTAYEMRISDWSSDVCSSDLDEVRRVVTQQVSQTISGLESVGGFGGKAVALAQGELYSDDPGSYKKDLENLAAQTPANVQAVADKWLSRPTHEIGRASCRERVCQ